MNKDFPGERGDLFDWNAAAIAQLRALWDEGHSSAEIARRMGTSKNAIVGKAHRLQLPGRPSPIRQAGSGSRPHQPRRIAPPKLAALMPMAVSSAPPVVSPVEPRTVFRPVKAGPCRYPLWGDRERPTHRYCDAPAGASGYCPQHHAVCWVKPVPMRIPMMAGRAA